MTRSRGPPPRSLVRLYYLVSENPLVLDEELAEKLEVKVVTVKNYKWRLRKKLANGLQVSNYCHECMGESVYLDEETGERVCHKCGLVVENQPQFSESLPWDTTYALTSNIAFGKSLGGTTPKMYKVIARSPSGSEDLPIRATQIQVISNAVDPPKVRSMLDYGGKLLRELGFDGDTDYNHILADRYGRLLRLSGSLIEVSKMKVQPHLMARAILYLLLRETKEEKKAAELRRRYSPPAKYVAIANALSGIEMMVRRS